MAIDPLVPIIFQILIKCWHMLPKKLTTKKKMLLIPRSKERCGISLHYFTHSREKKADSSAVKHDFWPQFSTKLWMKEKVEESSLLLMFQKPWMKLGIWLENFSTTLCNHHLIILAYAVPSSVPAYGTSFMKFLTFFDSVNKPFFPSQD